MRTHLVFALLFCYTISTAQYPYGNGGSCNTGKDYWDFVPKNCTSYAAYKVNEANDNSVTINPVFRGTMAPGGGTDLPCTQNSGSLSHACRWAMRLQSLGYYISDIATPGAIAHWNANEPGAGSVGHVAYVESVASDGKANISEYNITPCSYGTRTVNAPRYIRFNRFMVVGNITINPNPIVNGLGATVTLQVKNNFNEACTASFRCGLYNSSNQFVGEIQAPSTISFAANETRTLTFTKTQGITSAPGSYKIWIESRVASNSPWTLLHKPNASSTVNVNIVAALNVTPTSLTYSPAASTKTASIQAGVNWTASKSQPWIMISPASGSANSTTQMNISVAANTGQSLRTGIVTITGSGFTKTITVIQDGTNIVVSPTSLSYLPGASTRSATIQSTVNWTATKTSWITINPSSGSAGSTVQMSISVPAYIGTTTRVGTVTISGGGITRTITVTQAGVAISVSPSSRNVSKLSGSTTFSISSNVSWSASDNATWLTLSPTSGTGNATLTASFSANTTPGPRTATITISGGGTTRTCTVVQSATSLKGDGSQNEETNTFGGAEQPDTQPIIVEDRTDAPWLDGRTQIFPNPAGEQTQVKFAVQDVTEAVLMVFDQSGRVVYQNKATVDPGEHVWTVPLGGWAAGHYTAVMAKGQASESIRFVVQR